MKFFESLEGQPAQQIFTYGKSKIKTLEKCEKYVQS